MFSILNQISETNGFFVGLSKEDNDGDFILLHYLHKFLLSFDKIILISLNYSFNHYYKILIRYGINLNTEIDIEKFEFYDLSYFLSNTKDSLYDKFVHVIKRYELCNEKKSIFIDDLSIISIMGYDIRYVFNLVYILYTNAQNYLTEFIFIGYSCSKDISTSEYKFGTLISKICDQLYEVKRLNTGKSEEFHGKVH